MPSMVMTDSKRSPSFLPAAAGDAEGSAVAVGLTEGVGVAVGAGVADSVVDADPA